MTGELAHVRPEPLEAPEPSPVTAEAMIRYRAVLHGWNLLRGFCSGPVSFPAFLAAVNAYEFHRDCASLDRQGHEERAHAMRRDDPLRLAQWRHILAGPTVGGPKLPSLEEPAPGTACPRCFAGLRLVGYCAACGWREEGGR